MLLRKSMRYISIYGSRGHEDKRGQLAYKRDRGNKQRTDQEESEDERKGHNQWVKVVVGGSARAVQARNSRPITK